MLSVQWTLHKCCLILHGLLIVINHYQSTTFGDEMATFGKISKHCVETEEWTQYVKRLEFFLIANKVIEEEMK